MTCGKCGAAIADDVNVCPQCGTSVARPTVVEGKAAAIPNHLVGAIISTLCCCLPFGIPAIIFATQVNSKIAAGDLEGARKASKNALTWMLVSIGVGIVLQVINILIQVIIPFVAKMASDM